MRRKRNRTLFLACILGLAILSRFWNLTNLFHWTLDEEYWSYVAHNVATGYHVPLIGGPIGGTGVYLGPLFVWLMGGVFFVVRSNPGLIAVVMSALGVGVVGGIYLLFRNLVNKKVALGAACLYAVSTLAVMYDRKYWNASLTPLLSILSLWLVHKIRTQPNWIRVIGLGLVVSLAINAHMTGLVLVLLGLISFWVYKISFKWLLVYVVTILICHLPLLAFDLRHDFTNARAIGQILTGKNQSELVTQTPPQPIELTVLTFARLLYTPATDVSQELTLCRDLATARSRPPQIYQIISLLTLVYAGYLLIKKRDLFALLIVTNFLLVFGYAWLIPNSFYPGQLSEYYYLPSFVAFLVLFVQLLFNISKKRLFIPTTLIVFLVIINLQTTIHLRHSYGYAQKYELVKVAIDQIEDSSFSLGVEGHPCQIYGYRYLFTWLKKEPVISYLDGNFSWLYQKRLAPNQPELELLIEADSARMRLNEVD